MKRILINATHNEEIRVALCKGNHLYDFDLENRTREQKKSNIYKAHVTRVEPSLEAVFVEYGAERQGFLPIREIAKEYLNGGNSRDTNIRDLIKEGDTLIVQVEKEERGNKGAALSTYISLAGRYLVLMPNNPRGGGISRQISGKNREEMKKMIANMDIPKGMSMIVRTAGIGKTQEDLQHDLNHLLNIWTAIGEQNRKYASPRLVHQEAGVVTRAVRDYLRDDIAEVWIDSEQAYNEAENFISAVMPKQIGKLRTYTDYEPMFARFGIEKQIETAYQREVRLPSGGSIVIDQTEAMVAIDINSAKSTKGSDVSETAYHTNLEAADEIARQLRLRDMGGLVVIDFIDMYENKHQKDVEKRLVEATKYDRARVQFGEISKFGLMEMSRQRLRPSLEESTGYKCPRCHGTGMVRDLRSLSLSIMRQIEQIALKERQGEVQAEVPTDIAAFLLNEKRDTLVYLEQDSGTRITILPHAHMESPQFKLNFNREGFAPSSYERISDTHEQESTDLGYEVDWQTADVERPEQQPTRKPRKGSQSDNGNKQSRSSSQQPNQNKRDDSHRNNSRNNNQAQAISPAQQQPQAAAWLANLFAPTPQARTSDSLTGSDAANAIESLVNAGGQSLGSFGQMDVSALVQKPATQQSGQTSEDEQTDDYQSSRKRKSRKEKYKSRKKDRRQNNEDNNETNDNNAKNSSKYSSKNNETGTEAKKSRERHDDNQRKEKREANSRRDSRGVFARGETLTPKNVEAQKLEQKTEQENSSKENARNEQKQDRRQGRNKSRRQANNSEEVNVQVTNNESGQKEQAVVHLSLDKSKPVKPSKAKAETKQDKQTETKAVTNVATIDAVQTAMAVDPQPHSAQSAMPATSAEAKAADVNTKTEQTSVATQPISQTQQTEQQAETKNQAQTGYLFAGIFDERYVTAQKFAQASNDPRVVRANLNKPLVATTATATAPITGSVGDFIRATLDDAESRLATDGVIACFTQAVTKAKGALAPVTNQDQTNDVSDVNSNNDDFDFSNYGYAPLSADYLAKFAVMTQSVAKFATEQGKTQVEPSPIGKRASNDPRGQHPDYVENETAGNDVVENDVAVEPVAKTTDKTQAQDADVKKAAETVVTPAEPATVPAEEIEIADDFKAEAEAKVKEEPAEPVKAEVVEESFTDDFNRMLDEQNDEQTVEEAKEADGETKERGKTSFGEYKDMLANVSEQLSTKTRTNSLFLSTPTIPKTRSRKKKDK